MKKNEFQHFLLHDEDRDMKLYWNYYELWNLCAPTQNIHCKIHRFDIEWWFMLYGTTNNVSFIQHENYIVVVFDL